MIKYSKLVCKSSQEHLPIALLRLDQKLAKDSKLAALFKALSTSNKPASPVTMKQENRTKKQEDFTFWNTQPGN